jgi:putative ABC transport system ATP-binding protein
MSDRDAAIPSPLLHAEHLRKVYPDGKVVALEDVSLAIAPGEHVAIMGPSGCGKSTLLNLLGALDRPDSGEVFFEGVPLSRQPALALARLRSRKIGFVFQSFHLLPTLTALENVQVPMFGGPLSAPGRARKARELLETVGMLHRAKHTPVQLSVGERQRVAIARALANDPVLLLADEPTGNLDSHTAAEVLELFSSLNRDRGLTLVIVTHSPEVAHGSGRVVWLSDGRLVKDERNPDAENHPRAWASSGLPPSLS